MRRYMILTAFCVGASLMTPLAMSAGEKRYYDKDGHDYHTWNDREDRAYRIYLRSSTVNIENSRRTKASEQRDYFRWRHEHPDNVIFKVDVQ